MKLIKLSRANCFLGCLFLTAGQAWAQRPLGCDVASYQAGVSWTQVTNAGMKFAWAKATQSTDYVNPDFVSQVNGAKAAHVYIGAYHYATPSTDPNITGAKSADTEAAYFWATAGSYVKYGGSYLVPMLDWEDTGETTQLSAATLSAWVNEWCLSVSNQAAAAGVVGVRPVVYTGTWYSEPSSSYSGLTTAVTNWPNWMSDYSGASAQTGSPSGYTYPWPSWKIWQYDDTNTAVAGWTGGDVDVYNGTLTGFLQTFLVGGTQAPSITTNPTNVTVALGTNVTLSVAGSGSAPLSFQWWFDGKLISGATSSNYTMAKVQLTNAGGYTVSISNTYANISSSASFLSVLAPLTNATGSILAPTNLVNWWTADGNSVDLSGTNDLTPYNGLSYTNGEQGLAFHFDGSTAYLLPTGGATNIPPNWTLCLWVYHQDAPGVSASLMGDATYAIKLEQYNDTREVGISQSGVADYYFKCSVPTNTWTHVALVNNGSLLALYTNGVLATSQLYSNTVAVSLPSGFQLPRACFGADEFVNGSQTDFLLGGLDQILTFHYAMSAGEIAAIYRAGNAGLVCAPQFTGIATNGNNQVKLSLRGLTGKNITLQRSTNLINWSSLGALSNPTGAVQYLDSAAAPNYFYRATQPQSK